jgi:hypothetical protein
MRSSGEPSRVRPVYILGTSEKCHLGSDLEMKHWR